MRYPDFLKENGTIGFIAPSFGEVIMPYVARFDNALKIFKEMGYKCIEGPNTRLALNPGKSNSDEACGAEINDFFTVSCRIIQDTDHLCGSRNSPV